MDNLQQQKFTELLKDKTFIRKISQMNNLQALQDAFKENGVSITIEELENIIDIVAKSSEQELELTSEELDKITGSSDIFSYLFYTLRGYVALFACIFCSKILNNIFQIKK